jgi:glycosyltransferase involved in cell wall biosynthesis
MLSDEAKAALRVYKNTKELKPDLVHSHQAAWIIGASKVNKKIITLHSYKKIARKSVSFVNNLIHETIIPRVTDLITTKYSVVGDKLKKELTKDTRKEVLVIGNPINREFNFKYNKKKINEIRIVTCCIITRRKRVDRIVNILDMLKITHQSSRLTIIGPVGDVVYYKELLKLIKDKNLIDCVEFTGECNTKQVAEHYKNANLGMFLSEEETFGLVPLEMIMSGLPVITTKTGIINDQYHEFKKFESVRIIEDCDFDETNLNIIELISSDTKYAREYIENNFMASGVVDKYENTYKIMLA